MAKDSDFKIKMTISDEFKMCQRYFEKLYMDTAWSPSACAQVWIYPDGTQSVTEPSDGTVFATISPTVSVSWMWDGTKQQWFRVAEYHKSDPDMQFETFGIQLTRDECECGNKKNPVGQGHSYWCKLFKQEF